MTGDSPSGKRKLTQQRLSRASELISHTNRLNMISFRLVTGRDVPIFLDGIGNAGVSVRRLNPCAPER